MFAKIGTLPFKGVHDSIMGRVEPLAGQDIAQRLPDGLDPFILVVLRPREQVVSVGFLLRFEEKQSANVNIYRTTGSYLGKFLKLNQQQEKHQQLKTRKPTIDRNIYYVLTSHPPPPHLQLYNLYGRY
jgi:hypothetical protein